MARTMKDRAMARGGVSRTSHPNAKVNDPGKVHGGKHRGQVTDGVDLRKGYSGVGDPGMSPRARALVTGQR